MVSNNPLFAEIIPLGISRFAVRGFNASNFLSINLLKAMAAVREATMQINTLINKGKINWDKLSFESCKPIQKPINAKGNANTV
jgi:hypothetical protein